MYNVAPRLIKLAMNLESGGNPTPPDSGQGAFGIMQIKPDTMDQMGYGRDPMNVEKAIFAGAKYLSMGIDQTGSAYGALGFYHSGNPDSSQWGPKTHYHLQKAVRQWGDAQVNNDPNPPEFYSNPSMQPPAQVTASAANAQQGGTVANRNRPNTRPPVPPSSVRADERFPPDASATSEPEDPDIAEGLAIMRGEHSTAPTSPATSQPVDPDVAEGLALMKPALEAPLPAAVPVKPQVALPSEEQLRNIELTGGASELGNLLTNPGLWRGVAQPYRSGKELVARLGDFMGTTSTGSTYNPTYADVHAQNKAEQEAFDAAHPDSQAIQGAGNFIGTTGALMAGGGLVGAAAKGAPYVAPAIRFLGGGSGGWLTLPSGAVGGAVANTASNLLQSSTSDKPILDQATEGIGPAVIVGGGINTLVRALPGRSGRNAQAALDAGNARAVYDEELPAIEAESNARWAQAHAAAGAPSTVLDSSGRPMPRQMVPPNTADLDARVAQAERNNPPDSALFTKAEQDGIDKAIQKATAPTWTDRAIGGFNLGETANKLKAAAGGTAGTMLGHYIAPWDPAVMAGAGSAGAYLANLIKFAKTPEDFAAINAVRQRYLDSLANVPAAPTTNMLQSMGAAARPQYWPEDQR